MLKENLMQSFQQIQYYTVRKLLEIRMASTWSNPFLVSQFSRFQKVLHGYKHYKLKSLGSDQKVIKDKEINHMIKFWEISPWTVLILTSFLKWNFKSGNKIEVVCIMD